MSFSTNVQNVLQNYLCTVLLISLNYALSSELLRSCLTQSLPQQSCAQLWQMVTSNNGCHCLRPKEKI